VALEAVALGLYAFFNHLDLSSSMYRVSLKFYLNGKLVSSSEYQQARLNFIYKICDMTFSNFQKSSQSLPGNVCWKLLGNPRPLKLQAISMVSGIFDLFVFSGLKLVKFKAIIRPFGAWLPGFLTSSSI